MGGWVQVNGTSVEDLMPIANHYRHHAIHLVQQLLAGRWAISNQRGVTGKIIVGDGHCALSLKGCSTVL